MSTDNFRRRITTNIDRHFKKAAVFFGCSFVEGFGVDDNDTITSKFAQAQSEYRPYNYGILGAGPHQMLAILEENKIKQQITEKVDIGIYVFIRDHYTRILGTTRQRLESNPVYAIENQRLVYKGVFQEVNPIRFFIYEILKNSEIFKYFKGYLPSQIDANDKKLFCEIVKKSKLLFMEQFPNAKFYVLDYSAFNAQNKEYSTDLHACAEENKIQLLDFTPFQKKEYSIDLDGHPNKRGNEAVSLWLSQEISK